MRLDLAERMRCPAAHEATALIVVARRVVERELVDGFAGCPVCHLEARVADGVVHFDAPFAITVASDDVTAASAASAHDESIARTAALLGLSEPGGAVLLSGRYAALAGALRDRHDVTTAVVQSAGPVPFSDQTFRAAAIDPGGEGGEMAADAARTVVVGGRFLLPAACPLPPAVRPLAEDDHERVGERDSASPIIPLGRALPPRTTNR